MIKKSFDLNNLKLKDNRFFLFYGQNEGFKNQIIEEKFKKNYSDNVYQYDENEIIGNELVFFNNILSKSFFEDKKLIIINRVTDKIKSVVEEIIEKQIEDLVIILKANILKKNQKLDPCLKKIKIPFVWHFMRTITKPYQ